jgi:hypothetical protein
VQLGARRFRLHERYGLPLVCLAALIVSLPLWLHRWLPIQDLPQHLATLTIIHGRGIDQSLYSVDLSRTQYVLFYVLGDVLATFVSVRTAALVMLTGYMIGTAAAMHALLRSLGRDGRLALLVVPLLVNTQLVIGLIQFLIGIPFMLWGWSLAIDYLKTSKRKYAIGLSIVAIFAFYSHIVVFGLMVIGLLILAPWRFVVQAPRRLVGYALTMVPVGVLLVRWAFFTKAGDFVRNAVLSGAENKDLWPFGESFHNFYSIALDTYPDSGDEKTFVVALVTAASLTVLSRRREERPFISTARWLIIPLVCAVLFFRSEGTNGFLGHIRDRFAVVALIALVPAMRMPRGWLGHVGAIAMFANVLNEVETFNWHCDRFETEEVGDFTGALEHVPPGKRVAGLVYSASSIYFSEHPLLHYVAYYTAERQGEVKFTFAGYPHWVYSYAPHRDILGMSPPVFLWEWRPDRVAPHEELDAGFDYVITRGLYTPLSPDFDREWEGTGWTVWHRRAP